GRGGAGRPRGSGAGRGWSGRRAAAAGARRCGQSTHDPRPRGSGRWAPRWRCPMSREIPFPVGRVEDAQFRAKRRAVVKIALGKLAKILGTKTDPTDADVIDAFTDATAFIAPRFVTAAADVIISTSEYFPKPAGLRKAAVELAERQRRADAAARNIQR